MPFHLEVKYLPEVWNQRPQRNIKRNAQVALWFSNTKDNVHSNVQHHLRADDH